MESWLPQAPTWLNGWTPWIIALCFASAWVLDKFLLKSFTLKGQITKNKKDTVDLISTELGIWKEKAEEYKNALEELNSKSSPDNLLNKDATGQKDVLKDQPAISSEAPVSQEKDEPSPFQKGVALIESGHYDEGIANLRRAAVEEPDIDRDLDYVAFGYYHAFKHGNRDALSELRSLVSDKPRNPTTSSWLARALSHIGEHQDSVGVLEEVLQFTHDEETQITLTVLIAEQMMLLEKRDLALERLNGLASKIDTTHLRGRLYKKIAEIYEKQKDWRRAFALYEHALLCDPADADMRFHVAYSYSQKLAPKLAFYHYQQLLLTKKTDATLNNIGVAASNLSMPITATAYYRQAIEQGNTLASSNLANKLISIGFIDEASAILADALQKPDVDEKVHIAHAKIAELKSAEKEKIEDLNKDVSVYRKWRLLFAKSLNQPYSNPAAITGFYQSKAGTINITVDSLGVVTGELRASQDEHPAELTGQLYGTAITFSLYWKAPNSWTSSRSEEGILIIDGNQLNGYSSINGLSIDAVSEPKITQWELVRSIPTDK